MAQLAGLPKDVIRRAREILDNLENNALADAGYSGRGTRIREERKNLPRPRNNAVRNREELRDLQPSLFDE